MKHFVVEIIYTVPLEKIQQFQEAHRSFIDAGFSKGTLLLAGPQVPRTGGIIIAREESMENLADFFSNDPYLKEGLAEYKYIEFTPIKQQEFMKGWL